MQPKQKLSPAERRKMKKQAKAAAQSVKSGRFNERVANIKETADTGSRYFTIGYEYYRQDLCEIDSLLHGPLRKSLWFYKMAGRCTNILEVNQLGANISNISNNNTYKRYFKGLADDVELKELRAGETARHFFYIDPATKTIQIIAHVNTHTPLDKQVK